MDGVYTGRLECPLVGMQEMREKRGGRPWWGPEMFRTLKMFSLAWGQVYGKGPISGVRLQAAGPEAGDTSGTSGSSSVKQR